MLPEKLQIHLASVGANVLDQGDGSSIVHVPGANYEYLLSPTGGAYFRSHAAGNRHPWERNGAVESLMREVSVPPPGRSIGLRRQNVHDLLNYLVRGTYGIHSPSYQTTVTQHYVGFGHDRVTHTVRIRLAGHEGQEAIVHTNHPTNDVAASKQYPFDDESLAMAKYGIENRDDAALSGLTDYLVEKHNASHLMTKKLSRRELAMSKRWLFKKS